MKVYEVPPSFAPVKIVLNSKEELLSLWMLVSADTPELSKAISSGVKRLGAEGLPDPDSAESYIKVLAHELSMISIAYVKGIE